LKIKIFYLAEKVLIKQKRRERFYRKESVKNLDYFDLRETQSDIQLYSGQSFGFNSAINHK